MPVLEGALKGQVNVRIVMQYVAALAAAGCPMSKQKPAPRRLASPHAFSSSSSSSPDTPPPPRRYACKLVTMLAREGRGSQRPPPSKAPGSGGKGGEVLGGEWRRPLADMGVLGLLANAAKAHDGDKAGVVRWVDAATKELEKDRAFMDIAVCPPEEAAVP